MFFSFLTDKKYLCSGVGVSFIIFLSMVTFACAGTEHMAQVIKPAEIPPPAKSIIEFEPELDFAPPIQIITDIKQQAYLNYMLCSYYIFQGNYSEASKYMKKVIEINPESGFLNKRMALLMHQTKNIGEALNYAKKSLAIIPEDTGTKLLLAELFGIIGDKESAISQYEEALLIEPENQRARMIFATVLTRAGLFDKAMIQLDKLIEQNPKLVFAYYYKGRIFQAMKKLKMAENEFRLALSLNSSMEPALFDLAGLYHMQGDLNRAIDIYKKLLTLYPMNRIARERLLGIHEFLGKKDDIATMMEDIKRNSDPGDQSRQTVGLYYLQNGMISESIDELDMIVSTWPNDYRSRYYLAMAYEKDGQIDNALYHFRMIEKSNELYVSARMHIAYLINEMGKTDEAIDVINESLKIKKAEADLYMLLASFYESENDLIKARATLYQGLEYNSDNTDLHFRLGVLLDKIGDKDASVKQMEKVLELNPNHADSLNYIGYTYAEKGIHLNEALKLIQKALEIKPESGYYIDSLGWVYFQQGQYEKALDTLKKAYSLVSEDPSIAEHLGDVYFKINKYEKSIEMYKKALTLDHQFSEKIQDKIEDVKKLLE